VSAIAARMDDGHFIETSVKKIRDKSALAACSVRLAAASILPVAATLIHRAIKDRPHLCVRQQRPARKSEADELCALFAEIRRKFSLRVECQRTVSRGVEWIEDPEIKRKRIGNKFSKSSREAGKLGGDSIFGARNSLSGTSSNRCRCWDHRDDQVAS